MTLEPASPFEPAAGAAGHPDPPWHMPRRIKMTGTRSTRLRLAQGRLFRSRLGRGGLGFSEFEAHPI